RARPVATTPVWAALLEVEAASLLITWGLWVAGMIAATGLLYFHQGSEPVLDLWTDHGKFAHELATLGFWYPVVLIGICLVAPWIPLALATALVLPGRQRLLVAFV